VITAAYRTTSTATPTRLVRIPCPSWFWPSVKTAIVVGLVLTAANQWTQFLDGPYDQRFALHVLANCAVPFCVAAYSRWSVPRQPPTSLHWTDAP
jgi:hypothetical protein